jgi:hypothetical protein
MRLTEEERQKIWDKVKRLQAEGQSYAEASRQITEVSAMTVRNWMKRDTIPSMFGGALNRCTPRGPIEFGSRAGVPSDIASMRERLVNTVVRGDMDEHALLAQTLKKRLTEIRAARPLNIAIPVQLLEAAE